MERKKACLLNFFVLVLGSMPCLLGFNVLSGIMPLGEGGTILDLEDFLVSNLLLPFGSMVVLLFCVSKKGWGFDNYIRECNTGNGVKLPRRLQVYLTWILPFIVLFIALDGLF